MKDNLPIPKEIAKAAFDAIWVMRDTLANVIASENGGTENDELYYSQCEKYINWYQSINSKSPNK